MEVVQSKAGTADEGRNGNAASLLRKKRFLHIFWQMIGRTGCGGKREQREANMSEAQILKHVNNSLMLLSSEESVSC